MQNEKEKTVENVLIIIEMKKKKEGKLIKINKTLVDFPLLYFQIGELYLNLI